MTPRSQHRHDQPFWDAGGWRRSAACRRMGSDLFFPAGERDEAAVTQTAGAKQVCARCDVRLHCLTYALVTAIDDGIWGGLDPGERRVLRRARRAHHQSRTIGREDNDAAPAPVAAHAARPAAL